MPTHMPCCKGSLVRACAVQVRGEAAEAQDFLCKHAQRVRRLADLQMERRLRERKRGRGRSACFSWIKGQEVALV
jgi:acyl-[acyl-carrier-protein] desaturase